MARIDISIALLGVLLVALALSACGGDDPTATGASGEGLTAVTTTFANGQVETTGSLDAEGRRQGKWAIYNADGQQLFEGYLIDDAIDQSRPWTEWNPDGSVRYDRSDGPHPGDGPW